MFVGAALDAEHSMRELQDAIDFFMGDILRLPVRKALNPNDKHDFVVLAHSLHQSVAGLSGAAEADALRSALDALDVDWASMSASGRDRVVQTARDALSRPGAYIAPKVVETFTAFGKRIAGDTKKDAKRRYKLDISADLNALDERVIEAVGDSQGNYVRDQYGTRSEALSAKVKEAVSSGLEQGLGSRDITARIKDQLGAAANARSDSYWGMISMTFANRARTYGNLSGYSAAGIEYFTFEAVMDERTSEICALMHGKRFAVTKAIDRYTKVEQAKNPEAIERLQPWPRVQDGTPTVVIGGKTRSLTSDAALEAAGVTVPPLHGNCRSTIVPSE